MERLTIPDKKIDGGWKRAFIDAREVRKEAMTIYWALKKYEDTGLTPQEIMELKMQNTEEKMTKREFYGVFFYQCPICKKIVHDKDNFCSKCGQKLEE